MSYNRYGLGRNSSQIRDGSNKPCKTGDGPCDDNRFNSGITGHTEWNNRNGPNNNVHRTTTEKYGREFGQQLRVEQGEQAHPLASAFDDDKAECIRKQHCVKESRANYEALMKINELTERLQQFSMFDFQEQANMLLPSDIILQYDVPLQQVSNDWAAKTFKAATEVIANIKAIEEKQSKAARYDSPDDMNDSGDEDSYPPRDTYAYVVCSYNEENLSVPAQFVKMLPYCHPLIIGFQIVPVTSHDDTSWCYCPLGTHNSKWRRLCDVPHSLSSCSSKHNKNVKKQPRDILAHLRSHENSCDFHKYTIEYLIALYRDFNGPNVGHIAFENPNTKNYKKIEVVMLNRVKR